MAASVAREVQGITFLLTSAYSTGVFSTMAEVLSVSPPAYTMGTIDISNHQTTDYYREYLPGMIDAGTITFTANYVATTEGGASSGAVVWSRGLLNDVMDARTKIGWGIMLSTGEAASSSQYIWTGAGYITSYQLIASNDQAVQYSVGIKVTGQPTNSADTT